MNKAHRRFRVSCCFTSALLLLAALGGAGRPALPETLQCKVVGVHDGDTLSLVQGEELYKVRLGGIDAPERGKEFGTQAKKAPPTVCLASRSRSERTAMTALRDCSESCSSRAASR
jgi:endonuclease YncB( thermonuclease family)